MLIKELFKFSPFIVACRAFDFYFKPFSGPNSLGIHIGIENKENSTYLR